MSNPQDNIEIDVLTKRVKDLEMTVSLLQKVLTEQTETIRNVHELIGKVGMSHVQLQDRVRKWPFIAVPQQTK